MVYYGGLQARQISDFMYDMRLARLADFRRTLSLASADLLLFQDAR